MMSSSSNRATLELSNGVKMPAVGLGTWQATSGDMTTAMHEALSLGYRHFDTAILYENERPIGGVLNYWMEQGRIRRDELFVTTKLPPTGMYPGKVEPYLRKSLENLMLDYVDMYLVHCPNGIKRDEENTAVEDTQVDHVAIWKEMEALVDCGLTKAIGISNFSLEQIASLVKNCRIRPMNLQTELHVYFQQKELVEFCHGHGITVVACSPLGSPGLTAFYSGYGVVKNVPNLLELPLLTEMAKRYDRTAAQIMLRHTVQKGVGVIPKSTSPKRMKENLEVLDFELTTEDMEKLSALDMGTSGQITKWESWTWVENDPSGTPSHHAPQEKKRTSTNKSEETSSTSS
ncbi:PREDICTED: 1,5-anhydro-D-fructose reductase-like [Nicrophorus vespilloides]|uniref:1,5-anhydro-D-fructose reductase-like n=1 Tax=Nicrophorus vespilloides TaxID=110193 RepID=A0ABM1N1T6_NICVS|nr:PREDICTED: 1,5-anhydro-D-fructose reductase-like [Nicrophorus vespilloides]